MVFNRAFGVVSISAPNPKTASVDRRFLGVRNRARQPDRFGRFTPLPLPPP